MITDTQQPAQTAYCPSIGRTIRRRTREVMVGNVHVGGDNPLRVQSMTTCDTRDVAATVAESVALAEAGCEIVRVTAPNVTTARALKEIRAELDRRGIHVPLVADIHFLPDAALEAAEHVEKVRINPGNYADRKKFAVREYSDAEYDSELQRLYEKFSPLVKRCKELGRSMRIGTNHGSLSDRIMNRYGDTPTGMVESALEFLRIAESHDYRDIILSMKASNPKVMIQAYRLLVQRMEQEDMHYPLHLGVTEAGDGEDGRIKSAIGIGSLLADGLGDTIRVSLTEDSVYEIPVAQALARKAEALWKAGNDASTADVPFPFPAPSPFEFERRPVDPLPLGRNAAVATDQPPRVFVRAARPDFARLPEQLEEASQALTDNPIEGVAVEASTAADLESVAGFSSRLPDSIQAVAFSFPEDVDWSEVNLPSGRSGLTWIFERALHSGGRADLDAFLEAARRNNAVAALDLDPSLFSNWLPRLSEARKNGPPLLFTLSGAFGSTHSIGAYRWLVSQLNENNIRAPIWVRATGGNRFEDTATFLDLLLEGSVLCGSLLCDGIGDIVSIETEEDFRRSARLAYNILQGAGARISRTEFVACPSCGRTLFDLQSTTRRIREKTGHLRGVKIAVMGCIVNGPGEMADADFGYVGGAPGRVNLYVGKECVEYHVPEADADARLIELIKSRGKWIEP